MYYLCFFLWCFFFKQKTAYEVRISDWSSDVCSSDLPTRSKAGSDSWDLTSLLIGVNNQYRGRGVDEYRDEFAALLERAIGHAGGRAGRVLVLSIPDWGVPPFAARAGRDGAQRSAERRAGKECVRTCRTRGAPHKKKKN